MVGATGTLSVLLQPSAVYTFTTLEVGPAQLPRPISPPKRSLFSNSSGSANNLIFETSFGDRRPQEPGYGIVDFFGNFVKEPAHLPMTNHDSLDAFFDHPC